MVNPTPVTQLDLFDACSTPPAFAPDAVSTASSAYRSAGSNIGEGKLAEDAVVAYTDGAAKDNQNESKHVGYGIHWAVGRPVGVTCVVFICWFDTVMKCIS